MFASIAVLSALATVVVGQSASASAASAIPTDASTKCQTFLKTLNSDKTIDSCATSIVSSSSSFNPGNYTDTPTKDSVTKVLDALCAETCDETAIRSSLTDFYAACSDELTSKSVEDVLLSYDVLYSLVPFKTALCSKNDGGNYCLLSSSASTSSAAVNAVVGSSSSSDTSNYLAKDVSKRAEAEIQTPNATTFRESNVLYLFLNASSPSSTLCTSCTSNIMSAYIDFEASMPYAPGLAQSPLMVGQSDLYSGIKQVCGDGFLSSAVKAAGGISSDGTNGAASTKIEGLLGALSLALLSVLL